MEDKYTREGDKRFTLRIEKKLFEDLTLIAKKNKRAIGRQIEFFLEQAVLTEKENYQKAKKIITVLKEKAENEQEYKDFIKAIKENKKS